MRMNCGRYKRGEDDDTGWRGLGRGVIQEGKLWTVATLVLGIFIYKGTKMKLGSVWRADQRQSNGPTLRSQTNFYVELERFCCSPTAILACTWAYGFSKKPQGFKIVFITSQLVYGSQFFVCKSTPRTKTLPRSIFPEMYTRSYLGQSRWRQVKKSFFKISLFEQQIGISQ